MQKIINGIAIFSGVVALGVVGLGGYVFIRKDAIIEDVKGKIMESVMPGGLGGIVGGDYLILVVHQILLYLLLVRGSEYLLSRNINLLNRAAYPKYYGRSSKKRRRKEKRPDR